MPSTHSSRVLNRSKWSPRNRQPLPPPHSDVFNTLYAPHLLTLETVADTTYTLDEDDVWRHLRFTNAAGCTVTVPTNLSINIPIGARIRMTSAAVGDVVLTGAVGVTLNSRDDALTSGGQMAVFEIEKVAPDEWDVLGDVV